MAYDYGVFSLYGNKKQNKNTIMDIQRESGVKADGIFGKDSQAAYGNMVNNPKVNGGSYQAKDVMHTTPQSQWQGGYSDDYSKSLVSTVASTATNPTTADTSLAATAYKPSTDLGGTSWWGGKDQTYAQSQNELSNSFHDYQTSTGDKTTTFGDYQRNASDFARNENQQFNNYAGAGLGALQLGASLYSTFGANGSMAMNKKNMQLMDGQIANNNDIMATRSARAADISKYFG